MTKQLSVDQYINLEELGQKASEILPKASYDYYSGGATDEITLIDNLRSFDRIKLRPRMLKDVSEVNTCLNILDCKTRSPIMVAPMAFQKLAHADGELATARAASFHNTIMAVSTLATYSLEEIKEENSSNLWFQLYVYKDREITKNLLERAERVGYRAIVITVDSPVLGKREKDIRNRFNLPKGLTIKNLANCNLESFPEAKDNSGLSNYIDSLYDRSLTWDSLKWITQLTSLPILVKGILRADDAKLAIKNGARGIVVSNHGGRQLDTTVSTIEALPEVVHAVDKQVPIIMDGGIRRGTDILKALALGANAIFLGRPILWGLALAGETGVRQVLSVLQLELENAMTLAGCKTLEDIKEDLIFSHYVKH